MKPIFHAAPVNPPFEDPSVFIRILHESRALLMDCGNIERLGPGQIMDITDVFITHMHIDHFIGFDSIIRTILHREAPIRFYGPAGITDCIAGKLNGYTWNLIRDYPLVIEVHEIADSLIHHSQFAAPDAFTRVNSQPLPFEGILLDEPLLKVSALPLAHGIPSLGYRLNESFHLNIRKTELESLGLSVGPWLSDLKNTIRTVAQQKECSPYDALSATGDNGFTVDGRTLTSKDLQQMVHITRGQSLAYIMDTAPEPENISAITGFVSAVDELFCEAYFLGEDRERAVARNHLTALIAGQIAREAEVGHLTPMHFSPKYRDCPERIFEEAEANQRGREEGGSTEETARENSTEVREAT
jgi:ribonuclease Z